MCNAFVNCVAGAAGRFLISHRASFGDPTSELNRPMFRFLALALGLSSAAAGSVTLQTGDLAGGNKALDTIKAKWSQAISVLGHDATLTAEYDRNENENFPSEATLTGSSGNIDYEVTSKFGQKVDYVLSTKTDDGSSVEAEGSVDLLSASDLSLDKVTAKSSRSLRGNDYDIEMSHSLADGESKLKLSTVLGSGFKAIGHLSNKGGDTSKSYEVEYDTTLNDGRKLTATVSPATGEGEVEYVDTKSLDGELKATLPLGGEPKVTFSRAFSF